MYHRVPSSKIGWPSLNVVIFPPVLHLILDETRVTARKIMVQIRELDLVNRRILA